MSDQIFLAAILGPFYLVIGLSVLLYSQSWQKMAKAWMKDHFSIFTMMLFSLIFGLVIITKHNDWTPNAYLLITITGWAAFLKGALYFLLPEKNIKSLVKQFNTPAWFQFAGFVAIIFGGWLCYLSYLA